MGVYVDDRAYTSAYTPRVCMLPTCSHFSCARSSQARMRLVCAGSECARVHTRARAPSAICYVILVICRQDAKAKRDKVATERRERRSACPHALALTIASPHALTCSPLLARTLVHSHINILHLYARALSSPLGLTRARWDRSVFWP